LSPTRHPLSPVDLYTHCTFSGKLLSFVFRILVDPSTSCSFSGNIYNFPGDFRCPPVTFLTSDYTIGLAIQLSTCWWLQRHQRTSHTPTRALFVQAKQVLCAQFCRCVTAHGHSIQIATSPAWPPLHCALTQG